MHWREGIRVQELDTSQGHPQFHVPGWWLHEPQRYRGQVNLLSQVCWWELPTEAHRTRHFEHGQRWPQHQRLPVFHLHGQDLLVGRLARCLRKGCRRNGYRQKDWSVRIPVRQDLRQDCCCWLRPTLRKTENLFLRFCRNNKKENIL